MRHIRGGVIIIGSLFWETGDKKNTIQEKKPKELGQFRKKWREENLHLAEKKTIPLPIRYGRCSSTRKCTYTMVFSETVLQNLGQGLIIPFNKKFDFSKYITLKEQAILLAKAEGIIEVTKKQEKQLYKKWGCIAVYINKNSEYKEVIKKYWEKLIKLKTSKYDINGIERFEFANNSPLINDKFMLSENVQVDTDLDFLLFTYIQPKHRNESLEAYPTAIEIAEEINRTGYETYFYKNIEN